MTIPEVPCDDQVREDERKLRELWESERTSRARYVPSSKPSRNFELPSPYLRNYYKYVGA